MNKAIGFIGAGKVGTSLGAYFNSKGIRISGYLSKTVAHAEQSARFTNSSVFSTLEEAVLESDILFITTPDVEIAVIGDELSKLKLSGKIICHCSGSLPSSILKPTAEQGGATLSVHPLLALPHRFDSFTNLNGAFFTLEGNSMAADSVGELLESLGNTVALLSPESKTLYHASATLMTNLVIGLVHHGISLFEECGLPENFSQQAWRQLFLSNVQALTAQGLENSLTGPIERNDTEVVKKHLNALDETSCLLYKILSQDILEVAKAKHPDRDYSPMSKEIAL